jgi:galactose-1-phosphate uridylyltransferase
MPDGTEKQINPFTGTEVWYIPGRGSRPILTAKEKDRKPIDRSEYEKTCNFCAGHYWNTPPEKARLVFEGDQMVLLDRLSPETIFEQTAEFRRIPNLFEIVTINYWKKNFQYKLSDQNIEWKNRYLSTEKGLNHILAIIDLKLRYGGMREEDINEISTDVKIQMADAFFGGGHELIVPRRHYVEGATFNDQLSGSGTLSLLEHYNYLKMAIAAMEDIYNNNRYVRYIAIYQNWLQSAGASFDHLHKQLVALDEWGVSLEREIDLAYRNPNIYNEAAANRASYNNHVVCENDHALAFVDPGHRHPTIAIYSKSHTCKPPEQDDEELRGMSDVIHAIHAATGSHISCNEEWYFMPRDSVVPIPWHVLIKWRINIAAGFEGGTKIYVTPMALTDLRDRLVPRLFELRDQNKIAPLKIAEECPVLPNSLLYYKTGPTVSG